MGKHLPERLPWIERALQGLAFWIGHRQSMFSNYPLPEGALVAEACNLIQANLSNDLILIPEVMYGNLVEEGVLFEVLTAQSRADLVICSLDRGRVKRDENVADVVNFIFEVKRYAAPKREVDNDLRRLYEFLSHSNETRGFLILTSEGEAPDQFVENGVSKGGDHSIPNCKGIYRVRRTVKAAASFRQRTTAHYVCLIEVFTSRKSESGKIE